MKPEKLSGSVHLHSEDHAYDNEDGRPRPHITGQIRGVGAAMKPGASPADICCSYALELSRVVAASSESRYSERYKLPPLGE